MAAKSISERKKELEAQMAKLDAEEKKQADKRHKILGQAFDRAMQKDESVKRNVLDILDKYLTKNTDRELFGLPKLDTKRGRPATTK